MNSELRSKVELDAKNRYDAFRKSFSTHQEALGKWRVESAPSFICFHVAFFPKNIAARTVYLVNDSVGHYCPSYIEMINRFCETRL